MSTIFAPVLVQVWNRFWICRVLDVQVIRPLKTSAGGERSSRAVQAQKKSKSCNRSYPLRHTKVLLSRSSCRLIFKKEMILQNRVQKLCFQGGIRKFVTCLPKCDSKTDWCLRNMFAFSILFRDQHNIDHHLFATSRSTTRNQPTNSPSEPLKRR